MKRPLATTVALLVAAQAAALIPTEAGSPPAVAAQVQTSQIESSDDDVVPLTRRTFRNPPARVRPGTRWWWDSLADSSTPFVRDDALEEMDAFKRAGFGRFEIAWRADGSYGTSEQQGHLDAVARHADELGLQLDMTLGPGWPWATPRTTGDLGQQELMYGRSDVTGPTTFDGDVAAAIGDLQPRGRLVAVTAARIVEKGDPVLVANQPPQTATVLDPASLVDLTAKMNGHHLTWQVPAGDWIVFSFWMRNRDGDRVSLISERSVRAGLDYVAANQLGGAEASVRKVGYSFFEDSLELNADELYWTRSLPREFAARRGYDMTRYLPLMFVQGVSDYWVPQDEPVSDFELPGAEGARYRYDYYSTITDLYLDNHIKVVGEWARQYGMQFRTQPAYGNNFEVIRSSREAARAGVLVDDESLNAGDTPFLGATEHFSDPDHPTWRFAMDHYRQITSGAAQGGQLEVTTELGAWFGRELATSLREYRQMMDKEWAAGVTRALFHGYTHSPESVPWPGASHFLGLVGESLNYRTWPEWQHLRPLTDYWARGALVLQQGAARTDVAILRDSFVTTAAGTDTVKPFFDSSALEGEGYTVGYVDPTGVRQTRLGADGELFPAGPSYDALVIDGSQFYVAGRRIPGGTARAIDKASAKGLRVVFVGDLPRRGLSGRDRTAEDRAVRIAVRRILSRPTTAHVDRPSEAAAALERMGTRPAARWSRPVRVFSQLRQTDDARYYYLWNATDRPQRFTGRFRADGVPVELDLWSGAFEGVAEYRRTRRTTIVPISLAPHETTVLMFRDGSRAPHVVRTDVDRVRQATNDRIELQDDSGGQHTVVLSDGSTRIVRMPRITAGPLVPGGWQLQVTTVGPEGQVVRPAVPLPVLADWRTIPGLTTESGVGTYTTEVQVPDSWVGTRRGVRLDLGRFEGSVVVSINGTRITRNIDPREPLDVTRYVRLGNNAIRVVLATTPFNKALATSANTVRTRPAWLSSVVQGPQPYGLLGPVRLLPYARAGVDLK